MGVSFWWISHSLKYFKQIFSNLESEFLDSLLIGRDGSALDSNSVFQDGVCAVDGDLIVGFVSLLNRQVEEMKILSKVDVRKDELLLDQVPDDASHFVSLHLYNWTARNLRHFNFRFRDSKNEKSKNMELTECFRNTVAEGKNNFWRC